LHLTGPAVLKKRFMNLILLLHPPHRNGMLLKTLLSFHLTVESIPERTRNRLSPEVIISTNDNTPERPFFQPPGIAEVFIYSHGNIFPFAHMLNLDHHFMEGILHFNFHDQI
jgi:hypothetical protein